MNPFSFIRQHKLAVIFLIAVIILANVAFILRKKSQRVSESISSIQTVSLLSVGDYRQEKTINLDNGSVESLGKADLKSQLSAPIININIKLGDNVTAGQVLAQLQDNDIRAQLDQSQANLAAAEARLAELKRGSRAEDVAISQTSVEEAKTALVNSVKDAYVKSDDSIHNHIDKFFTNPRDESANFMIEVDIPGSGRTVFKANDTELATTVEQEKVKIEEVLSRWQETISYLSASPNDEDLKQAISDSKENLQKEIDFLNNMAPLVNSLSTEDTTYKAVIDTYKAEFSAARNTINGSLASLQAAETSWKTATKSLEYKLAGSSSEQIKQGQAAVKQAQASVDALETTLAKTSIVSPISGKISYVSGNIGEFVSAGTLIASVVNPESLQIKVYVSETDLPYISQGNEVIINDGARGIVQTIAPAVDSQTKKAEVNIIVTQNSEIPIVVGQNVSVRIAIKNQGVQNSYLLPIESVQFTGSQNYVFLINQDDKIEKKAVTTGEIVGEKIYITGGLEDNLRIVSSVRGLEAGESVKIGE